MALGLLFNGNVQFRARISMISGMKLIGLTGGIGMGKSTSARLLQERGLPVVDTDALARELVEPGQPALAGIGETFGAEMIGPDGRLRRDVLAKVVFGDEAARKRLEGILHPRIRARWKAQVEQWRGAGREWAVVVIPLLFETHAEGEFDVIVCVACTGASQRQRLAERGWSAKEIEGRIASQQPIEQKMARSHFVVWTEGDLAVHAEQLRRIIP
jgi:dephospho-CoA kinase